MTDLFRDDVTVPAESPVRSRQSAADNESAAAMRPVVASREMPVAHTEAPAAGQSTSNRSARAALIVDEPQQHVDQMRYVSPDALATDGASRLSGGDLDVLSGLSVTPIRRGLGAAKREARRQELMQLSTPWPRMRAAMVLGDKGESGKTPLSLGLAGAFGDVRGGGVGYVELNPTGNSARRLESTGSGTLHSMVEDLPTLLRPDTAWTEVQQYLRYQGQGQFYGLPARLSRVTEDGTRLVPPTLERGQVDDALATLARFWSVAILDGGNNFNDDPSQAGLAIADALLLPVRLDQQTCESAGRILDALASTGYAHLAEQAIIVVSQAPDDPHGKQAKEYRGFFEAQGLTVMDVPTDPHIHQRGIMRWDLLRAKTRRAYTQVALEVARRFSEAS